MHQKEDPQKDFVENKIQAILFADSFQTKFLPISQEVPKVLMPVANVPMIDYTIKFLKDNGIKDIIIFTCNNRNKIMEYFKKAPKRKGYTIRMFASEEGNSVGQALMGINSQGMIHSDDILLIFGDIMANFDLSAALDMHMKKKKDRNLLTRIFKRVPLNSPLRTADDDCVVIVDKNTSQVLQYKNISKVKDIEFNLDKIDFNRHRNNIEVHYDWVDTDITICTREIFHLLNEHYYDDFRDDLINDVLSSEIIEDKIHAYLLSESDFACKVSDFRTYGIVNQYVTSRWLYPIVPATHDLKIQEKNNVRYSDFNLYLDEGVNIAYSAKVSNGSVLGKDTHIDEDSIVERSVIGKNCKIGKNVKIIGSIIWNNVTIHNDCVIDHCVVADGTVIGENTQLNRGTILSLNVEVEKNSVVPVKTLVSSKEGVEKPFLLKGKEYDNPSFKLQDEEYFGSKPEYFKNMQQFVEEEEEDLGDEGYEAEFEQDVVNLIESSIRDNVKVENIAIELESSRLRSTATFSDCIKSAAPVIFKLISPAKIVEDLKKVLPYWAPVFRSTVKSESDEATLIQEIQKWCEKQEGFSAAFHLFLPLFYQLDILSADTILGWATDAEESEEESTKRFLKASEPFINFLKQEQEDDEEEEEEEGGEEEDDEETQ